MLKIFKQTLYLLTLLITICRPLLCVESNDFEKYLLPQNNKTILDNFFVTCAKEFYLPGIERLQAEWQLQLTKYNDDKTNNPELEDLVKKIEQVMLPHFQKLIDFLKSKRCEVFKCDEKTLVFSIPDAPEYIIKMPGILFGVMHSHHQKNIYRLDGATKISKAINFLGLADKIRVPKKYLYHIPGQQHDLCDNNYIVVAEKVEPQKHESIWICDYLNTEQLEVLIKVVLETGYDDVHSKNIVLDEKGMIVILDTEDFITNDQNDRDLKQLVFLQDLKNNLLLFGQPSKEGLAKKAIIQKYEALLKLRLGSFSAVSADC